MEENEVVKVKRKPPFWMGIVIGIVVGMILSVVGVLATGIFYYSKKPTTVNSIYGSENKLSSQVASKIDEIVYRINRDGYYDMSEVDLEKGVYKGLVEALDDPYARYYTPEEWIEECQLDEGSFFGVGATLQKHTDNGMVEVIDVYEGSPAENAGIKKGDFILEADGNDAFDYDLDKFVDFIRGPKGTSVHLKILHGKEEIEKDIIRDKIDVVSVTGMMLDDEIAYIKITSFDGKTNDQLDAMYAKLKPQGMKKIIFDLRTNGGGLVDTCVKMLDTILPEGVVVSVENQSGNRKEYKSDANHMDYPIIILTSEFTASASEIFVGAIQDYGYGKSLGTNTFGKGIVQTAGPLSDGSALKITTEYYYTPNGRKLHGEGIAPDIEVGYEYLGDPDGEYDEMHDNQIIRAMQELGSDIEMPEKFVSEDTEKEGE